MTYGALQYAPDGDHRFFLNLTHDKWADDSIAVTVDQTGLLQSASIQSTDQTGSVATQAVQIAGQLVQAAGAFAMTSLTRSPPANPPACALLPFSFTLLIDPAKPSFTLPRVTDGKAVNDPTIQYIDFVGKSERIGPAPTPQDTTAAENFFLPKKWDGIVFRAPVVYKVTVSGTPNPQAKAAACGLNTEAISYEAYVAVPNGGTPFVVDTRRGQDVRKSVVYTIQNGMLLGINSVHPSEYNGYATSVNSVLAAIIAIPSNLLTLHLQQLQAQGNISAAQATLLQNEINVITNQTALKNAKAAAAPAPTP